MNNDKKNLTLVGHLAELRRRIFLYLLLLILVFIALVPFSAELYSLLAEPLLRALPASGSLIAIGVVSPFLTPLKTVLILAFYSTVPYLLYQLWAFIAPGLYLHERRILQALTLSSAILFYVGILFAFFIVFPVAFYFLQAISPEGVVLAPDIERYLSFALKVSFAFGLIFEVPIAIVLLVATGAIGVATLRKNRPYIFISTFVVGMLLTPPDVISQILIALPMWLLFEFGLCCAPWFRKKIQVEGAGEKTLGES